MKRGARIDRYRIVERLGSTVFLVEDDRTGQRAALEVLRGEFTESSDVIARCFSDACEAAAALHPGIAQVLDVGCTPDGRPFMVSELIAGPTLASRIARGPIPLRKALVIARAIALALAAAHDRGIAHGALTPQRIFLDGDAVKIAGFGVAALGGGDAMSCLEARSLALPVHSAPEQCRASGAYDARSDLYTLGCILHEMLTGTPPYTSTRFGELLMSHLLAPPPELHGPAAPLVAHLLAKHPDDRPASAAELAARLSGLLRAREEEPVHPLRWLVGVVLAAAAVMSTAYDASSHLEKTSQIVFHELHEASLPPR